MAEENLDIAGLLRKFAEEMEKKLELGGMSDAALRKPIVDKAVNKLGMALSSSVIHPKNLGLFSPAAAKEIIENGLTINYLPPQQGHVFEEIRIGERSAEHVIRDIAEKHNIPMMEETEQAKRLRHMTRGLSERLDEPSAAEATTAAAGTVKSETAVAGTAAKEAKTFFKNPKVWIGVAIATALGTGGLLLYNNNKKSQSSFVEREVSRRQMAAAQQDKGPTP